MLLRIFDFMSVLKYCSAFLFLGLGYWSLIGSGIITYALVIFSFIVIPLLELILPEKKSANDVKSLWLYDLILYAIVPGYFYLFYLFLSTIGAEQSVASLIGKISAMGLLCGIFGINMAHELGHRKRKFDQVLAQGLLLSAQYTHFFIEHNRGHHKRVGTPEDSATARKGEHIYKFWFRVIFGAYKSAWNLEKDKLERSNKSAWSLNNDMILYAIVQIVLLSLVYGFFGLQVLMYYGIVCFIGILLLESINYIEHYGLTRKKISNSSYERVNDIHSWNSDHILGRALLFELTRHSHHHANSLLTYQALESRKDASQLPTGYPGMLLLSLIPPLWFRVMHKRLPSD
ncbi:MAG: alkane 1-monooxygenase [Bacteroidia bacterium]